MALLKSVFNSRPYIVSYKDLVRSDEVFTNQYQEFCRFPRLKFA